MRSRTGRVVVAGVGLAAVVALSVVLIALPQRADDAVPSGEDLEAAVAHVGAGLREGDLVRIQPYWFTAPRLALSDKLPDHAYPHWGLDQRADIDPLHMARFRRVWTVAAYEGRDADAFYGAGSLVERKEFGAVTVELRELPPSPIRYDLTRSLGDARVKRGRRACRWDGAGLRHDCRQQSWKDVRLSIKDVGDSRRQCIYAEPHPAKEVLTLTYPAVPLTDGNELVLHSGFTQSAVRRTDGANTTVKVFLDGKLALEWVEPKLAWVWRENRIAGSGSAPRELRVEISAPEVGWRQLCLDGAVVDKAAFAPFAN